MVDAIELLVVRTPINDRARTSIAIWRVPEPLRGGLHYFKYRLALIVDDVCVMRFDNEAGKGDHKHVDGVEHPYDFVGVATLRRGFDLEAGRWFDRHPDIRDRDA